MVDLFGRHVLMLNIIMNNDNNKPQTEGQNLQKLEEDLQNITKEAASTVQSPPVAVPQPVVEQTTVVQQPAPSVRPVETPPASPNVPVDDGRKGVSVITIAIVLLIVAIVVAFGYMAYVKFVAPAAPSAQTAVPTELPTEVPVPEITPQASGSAMPSVTPSSSPSASESPSASSTPLATP